MYSLASVVPFPARPLRSRDSNIVRANLVGGRINFLNPSNFITSSTGRTGTTSSTRQISSAPTCWPCIPAGPLLWIRRFEPTAPWAERLSRSGPHQRQLLARQGDRPLRRSCETGNPRGLLQRAEPHRVQHSSTGITSSLFGQITSTGVTIGEQRSPGARHPARRALYVLRALAAA